MTKGQSRAIIELKRLSHAAPDDFEFKVENDFENEWLIVKLELRIGLLEFAEGGLRFRERESFILRIPKGFPFQFPLIEVSHRRFTGFPHVIWGRWLCLYQSSAQWTPEDGLYGFFDRLQHWIGRAAANNMDPIEGILEPPHHATDFSELPFVIRENAPVEPGESWVGVAKLEKHSNRIDLVGWGELSDNLVEGEHLALATMLRGALPMEFPSSGKELFAEFAKQGLNRYLLLSSLKLAAVFSKEGESVHFVVGLPMRRSADGEARMHIAVWTIPSISGDLLRKIVAKSSDSDAISEIKTEVGNDLLEIVERTSVLWCRVMEEREEIVVRRDLDTPLATLKDKKILILGCGALGSWVAEMISRSSPASVDLVDAGLVKPGVLIRQNFSPDDYGNSKAKALAQRIEQFAPNISVLSYHGDAHDFIAADLNRFSQYDLVLDCTASPIFQMKLERDWVSFRGKTPKMASMIIDSQARNVLALSVETGSPVGIWDGYIRLKHRLCLEGSLGFVDAFYSGSADSHLFQPEPGCSDPTFVGSMADVVELSATALNQILVSPSDDSYSVGHCIASHRCASAVHRILRIKHDLRVDTSNFRIHFSDAVLRSAKSFVKQNARERNVSDETGGLLWGRWDEALGIIWVFDVSGPPPDSCHSNGKFLCGVQGTKEEHERRFSRSGGTSGFIGFWHTHPQMASGQSDVDVDGMAGLVSQIGDNQRRALMLIFGQDRSMTTAGIYVYESRETNGEIELVSVEKKQIELEIAIL